MAYVLRTIQWTHLAGCPRVDTTDGMQRPEGLSDEEAMDSMKRCYEYVIEATEAHQIMVNIEPHGYFTTNPDMMDRMLNFCDSPYLGLNMDTGNTFIAGQDPAEFLERFIGRLTHVHIKDVSESLAASVRGDQTGISINHCAIGDGANTGNIRKCLELLRDHGYDGMLSIECEGEGGPMIERSLEWMRNTMGELGIPVDG